MFPLPHRGRLTLPADDIHHRERLVTALAEAFRADHVRVTVSHGDLGLRPGLRAMFTRTGLVAASSGRVTVTQLDDTIEVRWHLSFVWLVLGVTAMMLWAAPAMIDVGFREEWETTAAWLVAGWAWLTGGNYLETVWRFRRFIRSNVMATGTSATQ
jgi:hypothetical protein